MSVEVTMDLIKTLRERTGVGLGKCKEALVESKGDVELAIANLRKAGIASAVKKEGREAKEGKIGFTVKPECVAIVEVNSETDFVANNERFADFLNSISEEIAEKRPSSLDAFLQTPYSKESGLTVDQFRATVVQTIGENIQIKRFNIFEKSSEKSIGVYSHLGGKILTVVEISGSGDQEELARQIAMHVAAASPEYVSSSDIPDTVIAHEKDIAKSQLQGKPEHILDKIIEGKLQSYFNSVCLERQPFIRDDSLTVSELVAKKSKELGKELKIQAFTRWCLGE